MADIPITFQDDGRALIRLSDAELRDAVALDEHDEADRIPALDALVLHFDFYGRLAAIEVTGTVDSVLPPALLEQPG